jgi:hypothetical protein
MTEEEKTLEKQIKILDDQIKELTKIKNIEMNLKTVQQNELISKLLNICENDIKSFIQKILDQDDLEVAELLEILTLLSDRLNNKLKSTTEETNKANIQKGLQQIEANITFIKKIQSTQKDKIDAFKINSETYIYEIQSNVSKFSDLTAKAEYIDKALNFFFVYKEDSKDDDEDAAKLSIMKKLKELENIKLSMLKKEFVSKIMEEFGKIVSKLVTFDKITDEQNAEEIKKHIEKLKNQAEYLRIFSNAVLTKISNLKF